MPRFLSVDGDGSWLVCWSGVWGGLVGGLVLRVDGDTLVFNVGDVAAVAVGVGGVGDNLGAAVGKGHPVVAVGQLGIRCLGLTEGSTRVGILDSVLESVWLFKREQKMFYKYDTTVVALVSISREMACFFKMSSNELCVQSLALGVSS